jgi:xanthine/uracil permease
MQIAGVILILLGLFTKFGAFLATIPVPIIGSTLGIGISMVKLHHNRTWNGNENI